MACIFCKIAAGEIPATLLHEDADLVAFQDINPQAPTHFLVVPRKHIASLNALAPGDADLLGRLVIEG
ncbi:MAG TPA: HIT domain-containing protein, partial [Candidatus Polarisedimenticolaceae bacterium]|nr:HIT domain-containing protein [Candidatus Polarisedimenticolaceae bacterium]